DKYLKLDDEKDLRIKLRKIQLTGKLIREKECKLAKQIGLDPQDCNTPDFSVS
ncbi:1659_t:CDS:2, partial [Cetraspora pellucida]